MKIEKIHLGIVLIAVVFLMSGSVSAANTNTWTCGEINSWAVTSMTDFTPPAGLGDAKDSIAACCSKGINSCNSVQGPLTSAPSDIAAWDNIVAAAGTDGSGGGNFMCVGHQNCWFVHSCYKCVDGSKTLVSRDNNLPTSGTVTVSGKGTLYFYNDPYKGWCTENDYNIGDNCKCTDGTHLGKCSSNKPKYCEKGPYEGTLIDNCQKCGCPADKPKCCPDGKCYPECCTDTDCNDDGWYDTGETQWITDPANECKEKEQKEQKYRDYTCLGGSCTYSITSTQWIDTGNTRNKADGTDCGYFYMGWDYCSGDEVWRFSETHDYSCVGGVCVDDITEEDEFVEDCNDRDNYHCIGDAVWFEDWGCVDGSCVVVGDYFIEDCDDRDNYHCIGDAVWFEDWGCVDGSCVVVNDIFIEACDEDYWACVDSSTVGLYHCTCVDGSLYWEVIDTYDCLEGEVCVDGVCEEEVPEFPAGVTAVFGATFFIFLMMRKKYVRK